MAWTKAQQKAIDTRNKNLLVSAASGSGKTAVLVERIISIISEGENPVDIDRLLVVTFTNAAAAQMRERIAKALDDKLLAAPDNAHLQKQLSLLSGAQITTIHSFCMNIIRNYFHRIDLDPSFRMAEESESLLLKSDVMGEVLERWYEEGSEDFHDFIESYAHSRTDLPVEEMVLRLYETAMSNPWPREWLRDKLGFFDIEDPEDMESSDWMKELKDYVNAVITDLLKINAEAVEICGGPEGPAAYLSALLSDRDMLESVMHAGSYEKYSQTLGNVSFERLSSKREEGVSAYKKDKVKELRETVKKRLKELFGSFFFKPPEDMADNLKAVKKPMKVLFELTLDFIDSYAKAKEEKNLIDFNDLEHFALDILIEEKDGVKQPSRAALELAEQYEEILIDEYQDSNLVQETILSSISRESSGVMNRFMVGDVKQSIYKFRLARPELFMEKYNTYDTEDELESGKDSPRLRIDLDTNFRSRRQVIDAVNMIFSRIMKKSVGGIEYDKAAALKYGGLYEEQYEDQYREHIARQNILQNDRQDTQQYTQQNTRQDTWQNTRQDDREDTWQNNRQDSWQYALQDNQTPYKAELLLVTDEEERENCIIEDADASNKDASDNMAMKPAYDAAKVTYDVDSAAKEDASDISGKEPGEDDDEIEYSKKELEARAVAARIKDLVAGEGALRLLDRDTREYRPARYGDIVILLRSMSGWSDVFVSTLMQEGIPAYADTGTGYFQTVEIMTVLNMLRIIDNPLQDIPFAGVLHSPIVNVTARELAMIRISDRSSCIYKAALYYAAEGADAQLKDKLNAFLDLLHDFRNMVKFKPIYELIEEILERTGYGYYVAAMPGGDRRKANLDMLVNHAVRFEKGSYRGLFSFIRYIERLNKYEVDYGEASVHGEGTDCVRIMSIHKSKGLEFPVVILAGLGKQYNMQDTRGNILINSDYGAGPEYIDLKLRTKLPTLLKKVIQKKIRLESMGEELRVLYVAMTRAKEKLIMTGYIKSAYGISGRDFTFLDLASVKSYLELVLPAIVRNTGAESMDIGEKGFEDELWRINVVRKSMLLAEETARQAFMIREKEELASLYTDRVYDSNAREFIKSRLNFTYPYITYPGIKVKMSVSELKKAGQFIDDELSEIPFAYEVQKLKPEEDSVIPEFIKGSDSTSSGTERGTLYHRLLELIDLTWVQNKEELDDELERLITEGRLERDEVGRLKRDYIIRFIESPVAGRMRRAQREGRLFKERQFVIGLKAGEVFKGTESDEMILIQGIVDVFFEEEDGIILLDYKSDNVSDEQELIKRYKVQLELYKKALEMILKKRVKEMIIYSLYLGREIRIEQS